MKFQPSLALRLPVLGFIVGAVMRVLVIASVKNDSDIHSAPFRARANQQNPRASQVISAYSYSDMNRPLLDARPLQQVSKILKLANSDPYAAIELLATSGMNREGPYGGAYQECLGLILTIWARSSPHEVLAWITTEGVKGGNNFVWTPSLIRTLYTAAPDRLLGILKEQKNRKNDQFPLGVVSDCIAENPASSAVEISKAITRVIDLVGDIDAREFSALLEPIMKHPAKNEVMMELISKGIQPGLLKHFSFDELGPEFNQAVILYSMGGEGSPELAVALAELAKGGATYSDAAFHLKVLKERFHAWSMSNPADAERYLISITNQSLVTYLRDSPPKPSK
jgi:hypothetical protein